MADALQEQDQADNDHDHPGDAGQPPPGRVLHGLGCHVLLLTRLAALHPGDHLDGQVDEAGVDDPAAQRLQPRARTVSLAGDDERGFAQPPQRVRGETDGEQPERDKAVRLAREQLQRALLVTCAKEVVCIPLPTVPAS